MEMTKSFSILFWEVHNLAKKSLSLINKHLSLLILLCPEQNIEKTLVKIQDEICSFYNHLDIMFEEVSPLIDIPTKEEGKDKE